MADETLVYSARFDPTGIEQGSAQAEKALEDIEKTSGKVFAAMSQQAEKAAKDISTKGGGFTVAGADPAKLKAQLDQNAAYLAAFREQEKQDMARAAARSLQTEDDAAEQRFRLQARREEEFAAARYQADIAEANLERNRWERQLAVQRVMMNRELEEFAGNKEAQEQIARKHAAIMAGIQQQMVVSTDRPERVILQRMGTIAASANRVQGVIFGVSPLLGNLGGGLAQATAGLMGVETALNGVADAGKGMLISLGATLGVLTAVGVAIALIVKHKKEMQALRDNPEWLGNPAEVDRISGALARYNAQKKIVDEEAEKARKATGGVNLNDRALIAMSRMQAAQSELEKLTGRTGDELKKWLEQFGGTAAQASDAFLRSTQGHIIDLNNELKRARLESGEGIENALAKEKQRWDEAVQAEQQARDKILLNEKATEKEKERARQQYLDATEVLEQIHGQNVLNIRESFRKKDRENETKDYESRQAEFLKRQEAAREKEIAALRAQNELEAAAAASAFDEKRRLEDAQDTSEAAIFAKRQEREREELQRRIDASRTLTDEFTRGYVQQQLAAEQVDQTERHRIETEREMQKVQAELIASSLGLAASLASVFNNSRAARYIATLQQMYTLFQQMRAVLIAIKALEIFGTGGTATAAPGFTPIPLAPTFGYADGGVVSGRNRLVRMNENGEEGILNTRGLAAAGGREGLNKLNAGMSPGRSFSVGDVYVTVGAGADPRAVGVAARDGIMEALEQIERERGADYYNNGTLRTQ